MSKPKPFTCSICQEKITDEYGNNAWPINDGRCCDLCDHLVLIARLRQLANATESVSAKKTA